MKTENCEVYTSFITLQMQAERTIKADDYDSWTLTDEYGLYYKNGQDSDWRLDCINWFGNLEQYRTFLRCIIEDRARLIFVWRKQKSIYYQLKLIEFDLFDTLVNWHEAQGSTCDIHASYYKGMKTKIIK